MVMKIIKNGDLNKIRRTIRFTCKHCGCEFEADKEDYEYQFSQRENYGWYETRCPYCTNRVSKSNN